MKTIGITISKEIMGGTPVFEGTRVPIQTLITSSRAIRLTIFSKVFRVSSVGKW